MAPAVAAWLALAALVFVVLLFLPAPYGRHARPGWGPVSRRVSAGSLMEIPAVLVVGRPVRGSGRTREPVAIAFLLLWELHYVQRALVYPFRARHAARAHAARRGRDGRSSSTSSTAGCRARGCSWPGRRAAPPGWPTRVPGRDRAVPGRDGAQLAAPTRRCAGCAGRARPATASRAAGSSSWVSCPNYLGEIVEWAGWALATWSLAGLAFAVWTAANLLPRALAHHRWYRDRFPDYPARRRAIIPFLL